MRVDIVMTLAVVIISFAALAGVRLIGIRRKLLANTNDSCDGDVAEETYIITHDYIQHND